MLVLEVSPAQFLKHPHRSHYEKSLGCHSRQQSSKVKSSGNFNASKDT